MQNQTLVWIHIPKTAGTSLVAEIGRFRIGWCHITATYHAGRRLGDACDDLFGRKEEALRGDFAVMIGHFTQRDFIKAIGRQPRFRFATMLREPIERLFSEYRYCSLVPAYPKRAEFAARYPTFERYVDEGVDGNLMTHYLEQYRGEPVFQIVDRLVEDYVVAGSIETYTEDLQKFRSLFGAHQSNILRLNESPSEISQISDRAIAQIHKRNSRDIELYCTFMQRKRSGAQINQAINAGDVLELK